MSEEAKDIQATCAEKKCGKPFTIPAGEQRFFNERQLPLPKRCPSCRAARKAKKTTKAE